MSGLQQTVDEMARMSRASEAARVKETILAFVARVNARAEADIMAGCPVALSVANAIEAELKALA